MVFFTLILHISIVSKFSWEDRKSQKKFETMLLQTFFFLGGEGSKQDVLWECESTEFEKNKTKQNKTLNDAGSSSKMTP